MTDDVKVAVWRVYYRAPRAAPTIPKKTIADLVKHFKLEPGDELRISIPMASER